MPNSQKYPHDQRKQFFPPLHSLGALQGYNVHPYTGDVTVNGACSMVRVVGEFVWDALGYLDVIEQTQAAMRQETATQITGLRQELTEIKALLAPMAQIMHLMTVTVPDWRTRDDVLNGRGDMVDVLSATEAGLLVRLNVVQDRDQRERVVTQIEPPVGTLVMRGSEIVVTVNDG